MSRPALAASLLAATAACVSNRVDVEGSDRDVLSGDLRLRWTPHGQEEAAGEEAEPTRSRRLVGFELDVAKAKGDDRQSLSLGEEIRIDDTTFTGPGQVRLDADLLAGSFLFRGGARLAPDLALEGLAGVAWYRLDLEASAGGVSESEVFDSVGPLVGAELTIEPLRAVTLHARGALVGGIAPDPAGVATAEAAIGFRPTRRVRLFGGWRWWDYEVEGEGDDSDVEFNLSGPTVGIEIRF